mmetsp:Transcript_13517/g.38295  ORF Transcript_13517/g.38295 Transcript_13517/m.38295 type:complete len:287 (-) Transcript_13517:233-1093(-)
MERHGTSGHLQVLDSLHADGAGRLGDLHEGILLEETLTLVDAVGEERLDKLRGSAKTGEILAHVDVGHEHNRVGIIAVHVDGRDVLEGLEWVLRPDDRARGGKNAVRGGHDGESSLVDDGDLGELGGEAVASREVADRVLIVGDVGLDLAGAFAALAVAVGRGTVAGPVDVAASLRPLGRATSLEEVGEAEGAGRAVLAVHSEDGLVDVLQELVASLVRELAPLGVGAVEDAGEVAGSEYDLVVASAGLGDIDVNADAAEGQGDVGDFVATVRDCLEVVLRKRQVA